MALLGSSPTTTGVRGSFFPNGYDRTGEGRPYEREFIWDRSPDRRGSRLFGLTLLGPARGVVRKSLSTAVGRGRQSAAAHVPGYVGERIAWHTGARSVLHISQG